MVCGIAKYGLNSRARIQVRDFKGDWLSVSVCLLCFCGSRVLIVKLFEEQVVAKSCGDRMSKELGITLSLL